jgi:glycerophosphoryl diester phosphodiesterase
MSHGATNPFSYDGEVEIIAHRGFSARAPENTLAALELGVSAGADAVEFDLQTTADGVAVLLHDTTVDRTTNGSGAVERLTLSEVERLDAGSWFDSAFSGERIPTLASVLASVGGAVPRVYAEIKRNPGVEHVSRITGVVADAGMLVRTVFISMDWKALDDVRKAAPDARVGYIVEQRRRAEAAIDRSRGDPLALIDFDAHILLREPDLAAQAVGDGIPLATWTVDSVPQAARLRAMGVPRITTNQVAELVAWKEAL